MWFSRVRPAFHPTIMVAVLCQKVLYTYVLGQHLEQKNISEVLANSPFSATLPVTIRNHCSVNKRRQLWGSFQFVRLTWPNLNIVILFHAFCTRARHSDRLSGNNSFGRTSAGFIAPPPPKLTLLTIKCGTGARHLTLLGIFWTFLYTGRCNIYLVLVCLK